MDSVKNSKGAGFSGQLGFVLAAAGSAVGVGNLWRFPYLAAKDGGGLFLLIYFILVLTFGYTLLVSDISIGRKTQKSSIKAYGEMRKGWSFLGILTFFVPAIIMTYYAVIGGWITKYFTVYITGAWKEAAGDGYFVDFITNPYAPTIFGALFMLVTGFVIYNGVQGGIERVAKYLMPVLLVLIVFISIYSLTLRHTDNTGVTRTGLQGLLVYLKPDFHGFTVQRFLQISLDAMSQLFFSLSVSMGIMITYGSYVKKDVDLNKAVRQIEFFDTGVAFLAGMMMIPAVFVFSGLEGMSQGTGLMFVALPKVFASMGRFGVVIGGAFFLMAIFATLTSCISVLEAIVANCMELFHISRKKVTVFATLFYLLATIVISLGFSVFYFELPLPSGTKGQLLDVMDYISNSFMMPFISFLSSLLIGWLVKPEWITSEMERNGEVMGRKQLFVVMIRYIVPVIMLVLFLQSTGFLNLFTK